LVDTSHCVLDTINFKVVEKFDERELDRTIFVTQPYKVLKYQ